MALYKKSYHILNLVQFSLINILLNLRLVLLFFSNLLLIYFIFHRIKKIVFYQMQQFKKYYEKI